MTVVERHARDQALADHNRVAAVYQMEPCTVTAWLAGPLAVTRPEDLALDGLTQWALLTALLGEQFYTLPGPRKSPLFVRLPLALQGPAAARIARFRSGFWPDIARDFQDQPWWWACSSAELVDVAARETHYWNKRFDTREADLLSEQTKTVVIENGRYKAYHQPLPTVVCRAVRWHAVGDSTALATLLSEIGYLGKKRAYGEGAVARWEVTPAETDHSLWTAEGRLARPVPVESIPATWAETPVSQFIAYRAPQYLPYHQALCWTGGRRTNG